VRCSNFFVTLLLYGFGVIRPHGYADIWEICLALISSGILAWVAEKQHGEQMKKDELKNQGNTQNLCNTNGDNPPTLVLPEKLDNKLARKIFQKAIDDHFMEIQDGKLKWKKTTVLLAYVCGRIYCGDKSQFYKREQYSCWRLGDGGRFPDSALQSFFGVNHLGVSRQKNRDVKTPEGSEHVDKWFE